MNDTKYIAEQLSQLRDLLIVIERGGDKSPDVLYKLAIEKSQKITQLVEQWRNEAAPASVEVPAEYALWLDGKTEEEATELPEAAAEEVAIDIEPISVQDYDEEEEYIAPFVEDTAVESQPADNAADVEETTIEVDEPTAAETAVMSFEEPAEEVEQAPEVVENSEVADNDSYEFVEEAPEALFVEDGADEVEFAPDDEEYGFVEDVEDDDDVAFIDDDDLEEQDLYNRGEPLETDAAVTVGEMLSVQKARELRKAFSLNDRFRFRRELFGNSDINMNNTLNLLDTMSDLAEARDYLLQDLGWSTEEPVVQEFLTLVERHFKQ